jgi:alkanesulfonate monooxygenase SsuD/methylene tetrahydromethanopterin reductase-like flavin-dependent oxidoreductase (luciferase family)
VADHRDRAGEAGLRRGLAVPCFADDPADLVQLGIGAERAGLDGYFLWDHLVHSDSGEGLPPIVDPWQVLAVVAARTSRIKLGTMITPVARRRPWKLAKEVTTLDLLSGGRVILGVGLGDPAHAEFGLFGEPTDRRVRAELLDEGLEVLAGLWTGQPFSHEGKHFTVGPVRFSPSPAQRPRVPIWVGGALRGLACWRGPPAVWPECIQAAGRWPEPPAGTASFPSTPDAQETGPPSARSRPLATRSRACGEPPPISTSPCGVNSTRPGE